MTSSVEVARRQRGILSQLLLWGFIAFAGYGTLSLGYLFLWAMDPPPGFIIRHDFREAEMTDMDFRQYAFVCRVVLKESIQVRETDGMTYSRCGFFFRQRSSLAARTSDFARAYAAWMADPSSPIQVPLPRAVGSAQGPTGDQQ